MDEDAPGRLAKALFGVKRARRGDLARGDDPKGSTRSCCDGLPSPGVAVAVDDDDDDDGDEDSGGA